MGTRELWRFDEANADQLPSGALERVTPLVLAPNVLDTQAAARRTLGWGRWNYGYAMEDFATAPGSVWYPTQYISPMWGGNRYVSNTTTLTYRQKGPRVGKHSVGGSGLPAGQWWSDAAPTVMQAGPTEDFAILGVLESKVPTLANGQGHSWFQSTNFGGPFMASRYVFDSGQPGGGYWDWLIHDGVDTAQTFVASGIDIGPLAYGAVVERATNRARVAICRIGFTVQLGFEVDITAIGTLAHAGSSFLNLATLPVQTFISHALMSQGVDAAKGVSANLGTIVQRYADAFTAVPSIDAAISRGRSFVALSRNVFEGAEASATDSTVITRDATVQALLRWDFADQAAAIDWTLTKTGGAANADDAGIASVETIAGDGALEFTADNQSANGHCIGLSTSVSANFAGIDYMLAVEGPANVNVWESGVQKTFAQAYAPGDVFRIERVGTTVTYKINGNTFYTSLTPSAGALLIDVRFFFLTSALTRVRLYDAGARKGITWKSITGMTATPSNFGSIYVRGRGDIPTEYINAGVELAPVNASQGVGELRWLWQDSNGALKRQAGGYFQPPTDGSYTLLTATRRWVSPTSVILRHYLGNKLLSEVESTDGDIAGSTSGTTRIGGRIRGGYPRTAAAMTALANAAWKVGFLCDEATGNLSSIFGTPATATAGGTPTYGHSAPRFWLDGTDRMVGLDSNTDQFSLGNVFDWTLADDFAVMWSGFHLAAPAGSMGSKFDGGTSFGWVLAPGAGVINFQTYNGALNLNVNATVPVKVPYVALAFGARSTAKGRIIIVGADGSVSDSGEGALAAATFGNAQPLCIGASPWLTGITTDFKIGSIYYAHGVGACTELAKSPLEAVKAFAAAVFDSYGDFFDGVIDDIRVCDYEMSREEIEATWLRISKHQPDGYRTILDLMQPGLPISDDPASKVQSDLRSIGTALGYGAAQIENIRDNLMPDRAYGDVLKRWEGITQRPSKPTDSIDKRRARVTGHIGKRDGVSPPGVGKATGELLAMKESDVPIIAFSNTIQDPFITIEGERWQTGVGATPIGLGTTTVPGIRVSKNAGVNNTWDAGCSSSTRIIGDGRVDSYQQAPNANERRMFGFTDLAVPTHTSDIKWSIVIGRTANDSVEVFENSVGPKATTTFVLDDLLTVRRRGDTIEYMKNETVFYTSTIKSTAALALDVSLYNTTPSYFPILRMMKDAASEVEIIFDSRTNVGITDELVCPYGARVVRAGGGAIWDGKVRSNETIQGDGYVEVVVDASTIGVYRSFSFSKLSNVLGSDLSENTSDYNLGWNDGANNWRVNEGSAIVFTQPVAVGDVLRIERIGSVIQYKKNGVVGYTSPTQTVEPLYVDAQFFNDSALNLRLYDAGVRRQLTWGFSSGHAVPSSDAIRFRSPGLNLQLDPTAQNGMRVMMPVEAPRPQNTYYNQLQAFCAVDILSATLKVETGIMLWNPEFAPQCFCFFGVRYDAGTVTVGYEYFRSGDSFGADQAWTVLATTSLTKHWLRVRPRDGAFGGGSQDHPYQLSWSTTGNQEANFSHSGGIMWRRYVGWWGLYTRSIGGTFPVFDIRVSEVAFRNGLGSRPFYWYALRDPALPGVPDIQGARPVAAQLAQAFTIGHVCSRKSFLLDDPLCTCDGGPMGGL